jgi:hypothetical protein
VGRLSESLVAFLGPACRAVLGVLLHLCPERFVGGTDLAHSGDGQLRRQPTACPHLSIDSLLPRMGIAHFALGEGIPTGQVERVAICQLGLAQRLCLVWSGLVWSGLVWCAVSVWR